MNIKIIVTASVAEGTDLKSLQKRIADQLRQISNPVRCDQGITVVSNILVTDGEIYTNGELSGKSLDELIDLINEKKEKN